jgi:hypothetical protein
MKQRLPRLSRSAPLWKAYERQVLSELTERYRGLATVTYDERGRQRLLGRHSGIMRQIDVLVRGRLGDDLPDGMMIVDCKLRGRKITVEDVEKFAGMLADVGADIGLLIANKGYTGPAKRRAAGVETLRLEALEIDEMARWLRLRPALAWTWGATMGTLTYRDDASELRTDVAGSTHLSGSGNHPATRRE